MIFFFVFQPDTYFHTGKGSHLHMITTPNKFLRIYKDGLILYSMRYVHEMCCWHSAFVDISCAILANYVLPNFKTDCYLLSRLEEESCSFSKVYVYFHSDWAIFTLFIGLFVLCTIDDTKKPKGKVFC